jgi:hypothetical protein
MDVKIINQMGLLLSKMEQVRHLPIKDEENSRRLEEVINEFEELWPFWRQAAEEAGVGRSLLQEVENGMSQVASVLGPAPPAMH